MAIIILTSIQDDFGYYNNLVFLRRGLKEGRIQFQGVHNHAPAAIVFDNNARVYDFIRSAHSTIRDKMTDYLVTVLQALTDQDRLLIQEAFDCLFNYRTYRGYLDQVGRQRHESMKMLIFNAAQQYVAHVHFSGTSRKTAAKQYTVNATLTCQCFTYFQVQETDYEAVLQALQNLQV